MSTNESNDRKDIHNSDLPILCRSCEMRHRGVCGTLNPEQLTLLGSKAIISAVEKKKEIYLAGQEFDRYSTILSGVVKLSKLMPDGRQQIVGLQFAPDLLGRLFSQQSDLNAEASTNVRICSFPKSVLEEIIRQAPEVEHALHEQTLKELDEAREWMLTLGRKNASEKVASFLYMIAHNIDPEVDKNKSPVSFEIPLRRADIADFLGLTIETVSRHLTKLRNSGIIEIKNNWTIVIPDINALAKAASVDE